MFFAVEVAKDAPAKPVKKKEINRTEVMDYGPFFELGADG